MRNPNAKTNALARFKGWIKDKPRDAVILIHLGEVDCGFVIWFRAEKYNEPIEAQMTESIDAYFEFVDELLGMGFFRIIVSGATLPTITDDDQSGEVVQKRSSISASQSERTQLTLRYNSALRHGALTRALPYIDIDLDVIDPATGVVHNRMRNINPEDHHMNGNLAAVFWSRSLRTALSALDLDPKVDSRVWRCTRDTYLKAYPAHSSNMEEDMKHRVMVGDNVSADFLEASGGFTVVKNVSVHGRSLPTISFLHSGHFSE